MVAKEFDKKEYDKEYRKNNILQKVVLFNKNNEKSMIDYIQGKNFNKYIHELIEKDMKENK